MSRGEDPFLSERPYSSTVVPKTMSGWSVWGANPRNPSCGLISLERGSKVFLRCFVYYLTICAFLVTGGLVILGLHQHANSTSSNKNALEGSSENQTDGYFNTIANMERQLFHGFIVVFICDILLLLLTAYASWKCLKALEQGVVSQMKKYFWILFGFVAIDTIVMFIADHEVIYVICFGIPTIVIEIMGVLFTYNYILERIKLAENSLAYSNNFETA